MSDIANNELFSSWPFSISNQEAPAEFSLRSLSISPMVASSGALSEVSLAAGHSETDRCGRRDQCRRSPRRDEAQDQTICAHYSTQVFLCQDCRSSHIKSCLAG